VVYEEAEGHRRENKFATDPDRWKMRESPPDNGKQFKSRHVGHPQVGDDHVRQNFSEYLESHESVFGGSNRESETAHDSGGGL